MADLREKKRKPQTKMTTFGFPPDTAEILCRLPVKDLLRFRCVSKPWCSLIDTPDFTKLHLSRSHQTNTNHFLIYVCARRFKSIDLDTLKIVETLNSPLPDLDHWVDTFARINGIYNKILGCCDGLVAFYNPNINGRIITVWNPSTRKVQEITVGEVLNPEGFNVSSTTYGFGYDPVTDDYKLVRNIHFNCVSKHKDKSFVSEAEVYSLRSECWRKIKGSPVFFNYIREKGLLANNALHWVINNCIKRTPDRKIVAFDLVKDEYHVVPLLECFYDDFYMNLGVLEGCLCFSSSDNEVSIDLWVMKEYGVKDSWTKLFSLSLLGPGNFTSSTTLIPLAYSKCGDKVLLLNLCENGYLVWYDLIRNRTEMVQNVYVPMEVAMCVGSLVWLNGKRKSRDSEELCDAGIELWLNILAGKEVV